MAQLQVGKLRKPLVPRQSKTNQKSVHSFSFFVLLNGHRLRALARSDHPSKMYHMTNSQNGKFQSVQRLSQINGCEGGCMVSSVFSLSHLSSLPPHFISRIISLLRLHCSIHHMLPIPAFIIRINYGPLRSVRHQVLSQHWHLWVPPIWDVCPRPDAFLPH